MEYEDILKRLKDLTNLKAIEGMAKYGIKPKKTYGVSIPDIRKMAKNIGKNRVLAQKLWAKKIQKMDSKSAKWIASDAIQELTSEAIQERLKGNGQKRKRH